MRPKTIIIRMPNWIGDCMMALPVVSSIRKAFPHAKLILLCRSPLEQILEDVPHDDLICFQRKRSFFDTWKMLWKIRKMKIDMGILLTNSFSSCWWFFLANVKKRYGYGDLWRKWLLHHPIKKTKKVQKGHLSRYYLHILQKMNIPISQLQPSLTLQKGKIINAKKRLNAWGYDSTKILIGIHPGAAYGQAKRWPLSNFIAVADALLQKGYQVIFFNESFLQMHEKMHLMNASGQTTLKELTALTACCDLFISNDSGPMHIAAACSRPLLALFGSTDETVTGPLGRNIVLNKHVACSPCFQRTCSKQYACMHAITRKDVIEAAEKLLQEEVYV